MSDTHTHEAALAAQSIRDQLPAAGLFAGQNWRVAPEPFRLGPELVRELETLGRVLLQFYRAVNLLYRRSAEGKQPEWVARWLDQGKPQSLIDLQRDPVFKNDVPRVIRPDLLLTEDGFAISELDSVPGGIGLTAWLNRTYAGLPSKPAVVGGAEGMLQGFQGIFGDAPGVHLVVSEESSTYRPEMAWVAEQLGVERFSVRDGSFVECADGDAVYRFFELFDVPQVGGAQQLFEMARARRIKLTPPPKPVFEEKLLFALLWNRNLRGYWRQELGEAFLNRLLRAFPQSWVVDPAPLPPHGGIPGLDITEWQQLKGFSQRERELILKVSGFSEQAWGARGVWLGSDLSTADWAAAVDRALGSWPNTPFVLQRFHRPRVVEFDWFDFGSGTVQRMPGRVRLCPYYFLAGEGEQARAVLGGVLATVCPADKKLIHGMKDAILAPCIA